MPDNHDGEDRTSLRPLDPATALKALLQVKPDEETDDDEQAERKPAKP